jgi:thiol-disulfide isomerase/thioredoxin
VIFKPAGQRGSLSTENETMNSLQPLFVFLGLFIGASAPATEQYESGKFLSPQNAIESQVKPAAATQRPLPSAAAGTLVSSTTAGEWTAAHSPIAPSAVAGSPAPISPIQAALDKIAADSIALAAAQAKVASLVSAQADLAASQQQLAADRVALNSLLDPLGPTPEPGPTPGPIAPTVSVVVVGSTTCGPCIAMHADIDALKAAGMPIIRVDTDVDPSAAKWAVTATPTTIVLVNGKEESRYVGKLSKAALQDWYSKSKEWADKYAKGESK